MTGESGDNPRYTRGGKLVINQYNQLAFLVGKELVLLRPNITIPSDYLSVEIIVDGRELVSQPGRRIFRSKGSSSCEFSSANLRTPPIVAIAAAAQVCWAAVTNNCAHPATALGGKIYRNRTRGLCVSPCQYEGRINCRSTTCSGKKARLPKSASRPRR